MIRKWHSSVCVCGCSIPSRWSSLLEATPSRWLSWLSWWPSTFIADPVTFPAASLSAWLSTSNSTLSSILSSVTLAYRDPSLCSRVWNQTPVESNSYSASVYPFWWPVSSATIVTAGRFSTKPIFTISRGKTFDTTFPLISTSSICTASKQLLR